MKCQRVYTFVDYAFVAVWKIFSPAVPLYVPIVILKFCLTGAILKLSYTA